jgi:hypothetical protein
MQHVVGAFVAARAVAIVRVSDATCFFFFMEVGGVNVRVLAGAEDSLSCLSEGDAAGSERRIDRDALISCLLLSSLWEGVHA